MWAKEYYIKPKAYLDIESGKFIYNKLINIKDEKIKAILDVTQIATKNSSLEVISLPDLYLVPGFIDCHTHLLLTQNLEDQNLENALLRESKLSDEYRINRALSFLKQYIQSGFTTLCDLGNSGQFLDAKLKKMTAGQSQYPSLYISGPGLSTSKAQFSNLVTVNDVKKEYTIIDGSSDIDRILKKYVENNIDILKVYLDNSPSEGMLDEQFLKKIIKSPQFRLFKKITFHATSPSSYQLAIKYKLKNLEHFYSFLLEENLLTQLDFITPTDLDRETLRMFNYYHEVFFNNQLARLRLLKKKNVKVVFGSDLYFNKTKALFDRGYHAKKSIQNYIEAGFSPLEILQSLSLNPAKSLGESKKIGIIKENANANFLGFKTNPLENISVILEKPLVVNLGEIIK